MNGKERIAAQREFEARLRKEYKERNARYIVTDTVIDMFLVVVFILDYHHMPPYSVAVFLFGLILVSTALGMAIRNFGSY